MKIAIPYFLITIFAGFLAMPVARSRRNEFSGYSHPNILLINVFLISFSAFRQITAGAVDEYVYRNRFAYYSWLSLADVIEETREYVFSTIVWLSTRLFTTDQGVIILTGFITVVLFLRAIKRYSKEYAFSIVLLMVMGIIFNSFNGIQQYLASAVFISFCDCLKDKKKWKFILLSMICILIHDASVFLVMAYFLGTVRLGSTKMWLYQVGFLCVGFVGYRMVPVLASYSPLLSSYVSAVTEGHHGVNWITITINQVPLVIALLNSRASTMQSDSKDYLDNFFGNMTVLNGMVYLLSSMDVYIARLAVFTEPFAMIYLSNHIDILTKHKSVGKSITVLLYAFVLYLRMQGTQYTVNISF